MSKQPKKKANLVIAQKQEPLLQEEPAYKKAGRKPKAPEDVASEVVSIKLTKSQLEKLKAKAGLVPLGTLIKHELQQMGII